MGTIAEGAKRLQQLKEAGLITPVPPASPATMPLPPIPSNEPGPNPLMRSGGQLPRSWGLDTDVARQGHHAHVPQPRIRPVPPHADPAVGAFAASQAIIQ